MLGTLLMMWLGILPNTWTVDGIENRYPAANITTLKDSERFAHLSPRQFAYLCARVLKRDYPQATRKELNARFNEIQKARKGEV